MLLHGGADGPFHQTAVQSVPADAGLEQRQ